LCLSQSNLLHCYYCLCQYVPVNCLHFLALVSRIRLYIKVFDPLWINNLYGVKHESSFNLLYTNIQFPQQMVYRFHWRGLSFPLLSLFIGILFFEGIVSWIIFLKCFSVCSLMICRKDTDVCLLIMYLLLFWKCLHLCVFGAVFQVF
jgi:hypothetical protein